MLRVGYPAVLHPSLLSVMPDGVELIALAMDWTATLKSTSGSQIPINARSANLAASARRASCAGAHAGTEWVPGAVGPHVTICNARGAHNISTAEWTVSAILHAQVFSAVSRYSAYR